MAGEMAAANNNGDVRTGSEEKKKDAAASSSSRMLVVVFVALLIDLLAFTMILPLLPALLDYYGHNDKGGLYKVLLDSVHGFRELVGAPDTPRWNSVLFGGLIGSLFSFLQFLSSPLMGAASDVYGRKPMMLLSMVGIALSYALWAVSKNFTLFVVARIVGGISKGNVSLSTAIVTDVSTPQKRGKGMALIGIAFSFGFLLGPLIGAYFAKTQRSQEGVFFTAPALFALSLALIDIVFIYFFFEETLPKDKRAGSISQGVQQSSHLINPVSLLRFTAVRGVKSTDLETMQQLGTVYFLYLFIYSGLEFTLTFFTHNRFQYDSMQQGKMFFFIGIIMALVQGGYVRRISPGKEMKIAIRGMAVLIPSFLLVAFAYRASVMYLGLVFFSFGSATVVPCLTTLISSYGNHDQKGTVMGIFRSLGALARAIGPLVASTVYWSMGATPCYCMGGVCLLIPFYLLRKIKIHRD